MAETLKEMIRRHEGVRNKAYKDHLGNPTIGIGHLIKKGETFTELSNEEVEKLFDKDLNKAQKATARIMNKNKLNLSETQQNALTDMVFQMGEKGVSKFKKTLSLLGQGKNEEAAKEALNSKWAKQTPKRAREISNLLRQGKDMAKEKKKEEKGPIGGMSLMDPIQQLNLQQRVQEDPKMSMEVQSMAKPEPKRAPASVKKPKPDPVQNQAKEEEVVKNAMIKGTRPEPEDVGEQKGLGGFQKALAYFGPRLIAQLVGGNDALAATDAIMKGFEGMQQQDADRQMRSDAIQGRQDQQMEMQQARINAATAKAEAKLAGENAKETEQIQQQLRDSEASIQEFQELDAALAEGGLTGPMDAMLGRLERMGIKEGGKRPSFRLRLEKLKVNEGLANIAKTKGAISDREMKLFLSPAPSITDDESVWRDWIKSKMMMEQELNKRLSNRLNINNPEDVSKMTSFDDVDQSIAIQKQEEAERSELEMLREKRRRMQAGPSATRRFK